MNGKAGLQKIEMIVRLRNQHCYCHRTPKQVFNMNWFSQRTGGLILAACSFSKFTYPVLLEGMYYCYSHTYIDY